MPLVRSKADIERIGQEMGFRPGTFSKSARRRRPRGRKLSKAQVSQVKRIVAVREELKFLNAALASAAQSTTPIITGIIDNAQGLSDSEHVGDGIMLAGSIQFRATLTADITGDGTQSLPFIRVIMFQWHPTATSGGATEPTAGDILLSSSPTMLTFHNHDQRQNYTIIMDRVVALTGVTTATPALCGQEHKYVQGSFPVSRLRKRIQYVAASSTTMSNGLYVMTFSNLASDAQNPAMAWGTKVFYRDA